jgi:hypothetical protein
VGGGNPAATSAILVSDSRHRFSSPIFVIHGDLKRAQEAVILGSELDLAGGFKGALGLFG